MASAYDVFNDDLDRRIDRSQLERDADPGIEYQESFWRVREVVTVCRRRLQCETRKECHERT